MCRNKCKIPKLLITTVFTSFVFLSSAWVNKPVSPLHEVSAQTQPMSACLKRINIPADDMHWVYVPKSAQELHTEENYFWLAGELIKNKVVDASTCPTGGLALNGYANACGMSLATPAVIYIQNMVNEPIMQAWDDVGVPPVLLKQLIRQESQFWPAQANVIHYGFGHITDIGIRNALDWNSKLYTMFCESSAEGSCATDEGLSYQILSSLISTCSTCEYGIDQNSANRSVEVLANVLLAYCYQTEQLIYNATSWNPIQLVNYATIWKLTLMNYNAGPQCVFDVIVDSYKTTEGPVKWSDIVVHTEGAQCFRGLYYANSITKKYFNFPPPTP